MDKDLYQKYCINFGDGDGDKTAKYNELKKWAYQGITGTELIDVLFVFFCPLACFITIKLVYSLAIQRDISINKAIKIGLEFIFFIIPTLVSITFIRYRVHIVIANLFLWPWLVRESIKQRQPYAIEVNMNSNFKQFISDYRSLMMFDVIACILAVDFQIFPREYAKTEEYGCSLMDIGVGSFILSNSIILGRRSMSKIGTVKGKLTRACKSIIPILVLGFARKFSTTAIDYHEIKTEYGTEWNFFFTIAFVSLFSLLFGSFFSDAVMSFVSVIMLFGYQYQLVNGLDNYILTAGRDNLFSRNREGILSLFGFVPLFISGYQFGRFLMINRTMKKWHLCGLQLIMLTIVLFVALDLLRVGAKIEISRRMTNLSYVVTILAVSVLLITILFAAQIWMVASPSSLVLVDAVNKNQLPVFLFANLAVGLTNTVILKERTLCIEDDVAFYYILGYIAVVCAFAFILDHFNIRIKI